MYLNISDLRTIEKVSDNHKKANAVAALFYRA